MKNCSYIFRFIVFIIFYSMAISQSYQYVSPIPESKLNSTDSQIIIRQGELLNANTIVDKLFSVTGNRSGNHKGSIVLSDDGKTMVFKPELPFLPDEIVNVLINSGVKTLSGEDLGPYSFRFFVSPLKMPLNSEILNERNGNGFSDFSSEFDLKAIDSLPADFPQITINYSDNPEAGYYFLANIPDTGMQTNLSNYLIILDNSGKPVAYKKLGSQTNGYGYNFKRESNGQIVHQLMGNLSTKVMILNDNLVAIDSIVGIDKTTSIYCNALLLSNGHRILLSFTIIPFDFSLYSEGGNPNGLLKSVLIQEYDRNKNLVFNRRSIDYIPVTESYEPLTTQIVSYIDATNVELDYDGNLLISDSNLSSIIKVSRETGEIMWKLGGKQNEFTFIGEHEENAPNYFSYQNHIKRLLNGNITLFDNGTQHNPPYSRAVEYRLDEVNKTCELIWEYRHNPDIYATDDGSFQILPSGNRLISWGHQTQSGGITATELHPDNSVAMEFSLPPGHRSMSVMKYPWPVCEPIQVAIYELLEGNTYPMGDAIIGIIIKFRKLSGFMYNGLKAERYECGPVKPEFQEKAPMVLPYRVKMTSSMIDSTDCEIRFNIADFPNLYRLQDIVIYNKKSDTTRYFKALQTLYEPETNSLVINTDNFGDFIFCLPEFLEKPLMPWLISPANEFRVNKDLPVKLTWSIRGYNTGTHLIVSTDDTFSSGIVVDTIVKATTFSVSKLTQGQKYYWKVNGRNEAGESDWSETRSFIPSPGFISVSYPATGDTLYRDTLFHIVRWEKNISDSVRIELYRNGQFFMLLMDSLMSPNGAYAWKISENIPYDSTYSIVITSRKNNQITGESGIFSISESITGVSVDEVYSDNGIILYQNYPNPANGRTSFKFSLNKSGYATLKLFDVQGIATALIFDGQLEAGTYIVDWDASRFPNGNYIYQLNFSGFRHSGKLNVIK